MDSQGVAATTQSVTSIVFALSPAFIAGFAVQQGIEIIDSLVAARKEGGDNVKSKKAFLSILSVVFATFIVIFSSIDVLSPFPLKDAPVVHAAYAQQPTNPGNTGNNASTSRSFIDIFLSIIFISAGTEGFNSLLKWINYKKEDAKSSAAKGKGTSDAQKGMAEMPS